MRHQERRSRPRKCLFALVPLGLSDRAGCQTGGTPCTNHQALAPWSRHPALRAVWMSTPHDIRMGVDVASGILAKSRTEMHMRGHAVSDPTRIEADYLIETTFDPREAAEAMAGEQSSGTFVPVPGETPELKARSAARIEALEVLDTKVPQPSLPGSTTPKGVSDPIRRQARVTLSWPLDNMGRRCPTLSPLSQVTCSSCGSSQDCAFSTSVCPPLLHRPILAQSSALRVRAASPASKIFR